MTSGAPYSIWKRSCSFPLDSMESPNIRVERTALSLALAAAFLSVGPSTFGSDRCPSDYAIEALADRAENLFLEFARAYGRSAGLPDLRKLPPSPDEMHVRLWHGF